MQRLLSCLVLSLSTLSAVSEGVSWASFDSSGPYCGLYCAYAALRVLDVAVTPADIMKTDYVSSRGSSLRDLQRLLEAQGLKAYPVERLSLESLANSTSPVILHVKSSIVSPAMNHYVLYVGAKDGQYCIYNPPRKPEYISGAQLLQHWYGTGIVVSRTSGSLSGLSWPPRIRALLVMATAALGLAGLAGVRLRLVKGKSFRLSLAIDVALIGALTCILGLSYGTLTSEGLLRDSSATLPTRHAFVGAFLPKLTATGVKRLQKGAEPGLIVDARRRPDYLAGHIEGAINIEPDSPPDTYARKLAGVSRDRPIVVYCQSAGCPFAMGAARALLDQGYQNIRYFKGGWNEWTSSSRE